MNGSKTVVRMGIDIGKNNFHRWGVNDQDERVVKKPVRRLAAEGGEAPGVPDRSGGMRRCPPLGT